eukprot:479723_1
MSVPLLRIYVASCSNVDTFNLSMLIPEYDLYVFYVRNAESNNSHEMFDNISNHLQSYDTVNMKIVQQNHNKIVIFALGYISSNIVYYEQINDMIITKPYFSVAVSIYNHTNIGFFSSTHATNNNMTRIIKSTQKYISMDKRRYITNISNFICTTITKESNKIQYESTHNLLYPETSDKYTDGFSRQHECIVNNSTIYSVFEYRLSTEFDIVVLGGGGVGKSALTIRLVTGDFLEEYDPTLEDTYIKKVSIDGNKFTLNILDTAGAEEFSSMQDEMMTNAQIFVIVYSITSRSTFDEAIIMREKILRCQDEEQPYIVLVGNKCDLAVQRQIEYAEGEELAKEWGNKIIFFETSAKDRINNEVCFYDGVRMLYRYWKKIH